MPPELIDFRSAPAHYRHWNLSIEGNIARLGLDVSEHGGLDPECELKLNSYDLSVDIELADAVQRLRFEHPSVVAVVITSDKDAVFSAGANIQMLARASHYDKVNFCKFTNETRNCIEDATLNSNQRYFCALNASAAGGGYELALATDHILLVDDGFSAVSLPEVPVLGVLPGTGGLTRLLDKRKVRPDRADYFCTIEEGISGPRALAWNLVDELAPPSQFNALLSQRISEHIESIDSPVIRNGIELFHIERNIQAHRIDYDHLSVTLERHPKNLATITLRAPKSVGEDDLGRIHSLGARWWPLAVARELDDLVLHLRTNEPTIGTWVFKATGNIDAVSAYDQCVILHAHDWFVREVTLFWKRLLKRLEVTSRSLITLIEPGSCFAGFLLEIALASDRCYMLAGGWEDNPTDTAIVRLGDTNFGPLPNISGISRLHTRYLDDETLVAQLDAFRGRDLDAANAQQLRLVTFAPDDLDWDDEVRLALEARSSFSPDALTAMEANLRFPGPETMESRIFARLSAWQNWIFQRPNAVGETGALTRYGSGLRSEFDWQRV